MKELRGMQVDTGHAERWLQCWTLISSCQAKRERDLGTISMEVITDSMATTSTCRLGKDAHASTLGFRSRECKRNMQRK